MAREHVVDDPDVLASSWEEESAELAAADQGDEQRRSILIRRSVDPDIQSEQTVDDAPRMFLEDQRIARLPDDIDDPFDEPDVDFLPDSKAGSSDVKSAIESEQEPETALPDSKYDPSFPENVPLPLESTEGEPYQEGLIELDKIDENDLSQQLEKERQKSQQECNDELAEIRAEGIETIDLGIRVKGNAGEDFPFECEINPKPFEPRNWPQVTYSWKAAGLCHKPLYFEQVQLERYGHSWGPYVQPMMSGAHFFATLPVLPYKMGLKTPNECVYTLGYYRPGSCAPYMIDGVPFTWRAALFQGGAVTGISAIVP